MFIKRFMLLLATAWLTETTQAAGNPEAGREKAALCAGCHGEDGHSQVPLFPKLAGQPARYLEKQLHDFKAQRRVEPTMYAMAEPLSDEDIQDLAAFYAGQSPKSENGTAPTHGGGLYKAGRPATGVPACSGCHGPQGHGNPSAAIPALGGQHAAYLEKTLGDYRSGERANDPNSVMRLVAKTLSDDDLGALADYLSTLK
jgi:cytochrome c553